MNINLREEMRDGGFLFRNRIMWHVFFWLFFYSFYVVTYGEYQNDYKGEVFVNLYLLPVRMLATYSLIYFIIPRFLLTKKYLPFLLSSILHALIYGALIWIFIFEFEISVKTGRKLTYNEFSLGSLLVTIVDNYKIPAIAAIIKLFKTWHLEQIKKQQLANEKHKAELDFLKTQIHPHFLFNTLNNLYSLTLVKSDEAPNVVIKLSDMLSYILYDCNADYVDLKKEIQFIENYIALQKIRHNHEIVSIDLDISGTCDRKQIAPLIILPIVENCFKHGVDSNPGKTFINIKIECTKDSFILVTSNSIDVAVQNQVYKDGLGLQNVKRRLELLYKDMYYLEITKEKFSFNFNLKIDFK